MNNHISLTQEDSFITRNIPLILVAICSIIFFYNRGFFSDQKTQIITSDAHGYYGHLPANFIYNDLVYDYLSKINETYYPNNPAAEFRVEQEGKKTNKFYVGTAILQFPFFVIAHFISKFSDYPADGYSLYYQYFIGLAALFYLYVGLFFLNRVFRMFKINPFLTILIQVILVFGTNLYHYAIFQSGMSHVYSFALISAFLYFFNKFIISSTIKTGIILSVLIGLIALCRPSNIIVVLFTPFFFNSFKDYFNWIKNHILNWRLIIYSVVVILLLFIQCYFWHKATHHYYVDSYKFEGFNFSNPYLFEFLFGFKKGFFIYTPFFIVLPVACIFLSKINNFKVIVFSLFFVILCYILSSWWNWYYGGSFGSRSLIDFYPLWCFLIAISFNHFSLKSNLILTVFAGGTICLNIIQDYQIRNSIMHWDCMNKEKYFKIFLKTSDQYKGVLYYDNTTENFDKYHGGKNLLSRTRNFGKNNSFVSSDHIYSEGFEFESSTYIKSIPHIVVRTSADIFITKDTKADLIISVEKDGKIKSWNNKVIPNFIESDINKWTNIKFSVVFYDLQPGDILKYYLHHISGNNAKIDNMHININELKTKWYNNDQE